MYNPSILSITLPEPSLIHISNRFSFSSDDSFKWYLPFITVFISELKWSVLILNSLSLIRFFRVIITLFFLNNSSNNFFILFLITDNKSLKFLSLIISTL